MAEANSMKYFTGQLNPTHSNVFYVNFNTINNISLGIQEEKIRTAKSY